MECINCIHFLVCKNTGRRKGKADGCIMYEENPPRAVWLDQCDCTHFCSHCGFDALWEMYDENSFREKLTDVCHHCGAIMAVESDEKY